LLPSSSGWSWPDDGGNKHLWEVSKLLLDYMVQHPRRQSSSIIDSCATNTLAHHRVQGSIPGLTGFVLNKLIWRRYFLNTLVSFHQCSTRGVS
jgi:hypothetical protein